MEIQDIEIDPIYLNSFLKDFNFSMVEPVLCLDDIEDAVVEPNDHHCDVYAFCDHFESKYEIKHEFEEDDQMNSNDSLGSSSNGQSCSSELSNFQARTTFSYVILPFIFRDVYYSILLLTEGFEIINPIQFKVEADKGFQYLTDMNSYVCQKKNHFQITTQTIIEKQAKYISFENTLFQILCFKLDIYGVKCELPNERIEIRQSSANDRKHHAFEALILNQLLPSQPNRLTAKRLHFASSTKNNRYKNKRPNPKQCFFKLIIEMQAITTTGQSFILYSVESDKIIVRAKNLSQHYGENVQKLF